MQIEGMFRDWKFGRYNATCGGYSLWIANEFYGFEAHDDAKTRLLAGLTRRECRAVYRETMREQRRRSLAVFATLASKQN